MVRIKFRFLYAVLGVILLCCLTVSCAPGDGTTLTPLGVPFGPPKLAVSPLAIVMTLEKGKTASISIKIKNLGGFPLVIREISSENNWIGLQNLTFPVSIEAADSIQITATIGESSLSGGTFQGTVKIISNDGDIENSQFTLTVDLEVTEETLPFEPTLGNIQSRIFSFVCTECHDSSNPSEGLDLTRGNSYGNLVNKKSNQVPELFLVEPFNPDNSYLIRKLEGGPDIVEERMPVDQAPVRLEHIKVVRAWISQGAQNN